MHFYIFNCLSYIILVFMILIFFSRWSVLYGVFDSFTARPYGNAFLFITYALAGKPMEVHFCYISTTRDYVYYYNKLCILITIFVFCVLSQSLSIHALRDYLTPGGRRVLYLSRAQKRNGW